MFEYTYHVNSHDYVFEGIVTVMKVCETANVDNFSCYQSWTQIVQDIPPHIASECGTDIGFIWALYGLPT